MDIQTIIGVGIVGTILSVTVKSYRQELGICVSLVTGIFIFLWAARGIGNVFSQLYEICENTGVNIAFFKAAIKMIAIAYITQFASEIAKDSGEGAIAKKIEFAGKVTVLVTMVPIIKNLIDVIVNTLMSF